MLKEATYCCRGSSRLPLYQETDILAKRPICSTFFFSHQPSLTCKQTPPPLDLSRLLQFKSDLHSIPKPGNEAQLSDILSLSQVSVRANRQEFVKSQELLQIATNSQKLVFLPFGLIDLTFDIRMDGNGKRFLFPLNLLCTPPLRPRLLIGTTLLSIYLYMSSGTGFVEQKLAKVNKNSRL